MVRLSPLKAEHYESLYLAASDPGIWEQHQTKDRWKREEFDKYFEDSLQSNYALIIRDLSSNDIIGHSRFQPLSFKPGTIEIGWTFLTRRYWGGPHNKAVKHLMINHAFQTFDTVVFFIDKSNIRSQKAAIKLGGQRVTDEPTVKAFKRPDSDLVFAIHKKQWHNQGQQ